MIPFILGGVALAVTGYGVKKYLEDEENCKKVEDTICGWIDKTEEKTDKFFDYANKKIDELDKKKDEYGNSDDESEDEDNEVSNDDRKGSSIFGLVNSSINQNSTNSFFGSPMEQAIVENEIINQFNKTLFDFNNSSLKELNIALSEIRNLNYVNDYKDLIHNENRYRFTNVSDSVIEDFKKFTITIENTKKYIDKQLDIVDEIIISSDDYLSYSDENKKVLEDLILLSNLLNKINQLEITSDGKNISREFKRNFARLEWIIV